MSKFNFNIDTTEDAKRSLRKSAYNHISLKNLYDIHQLVIDMNLPSGTLWYRYNLDVNPNLLSNPEDWYGKYYAWAELEPNKTNKKGEIYFNWTNYKFAKSSSTTLTKYCNDTKYGLKRFADNLTELQLEDDVAYQKQKLYDYKFCIPTKELCEELINHTNNYWVKNYDPNKIKHDLEDDKGIQRLNGCIFEGKNGNLLFIPAAGFRDLSGIYDIGLACYLWSSNLHSDYPDGAYYLYSDSAYACIYDGGRCDGFSIRPVLFNN